jgi:hypothetical protein
MLTANQPQHCSIEFRKPQSALDRSGAQALKQSRAIPSSRGAKGSVNSPRSGWSASHAAPNTLRRAAILKQQVRRDCPFLCLISKAVVKEQCVACEATLGQMMQKQASTPRLCGHILVLRHFCRHPDSGGADVEINQLTARPDGTPEHLATELHDRSMLDTAKPALSRRIAWRL